MKERKKRFNLRLHLVHREFDRLEQFGWWRVGRIRWGRGKAGTAILTRRVVARWMKEDCQAANTSPACNRRQ